jgi:hypothetical protein
MDKDIAEWLREYREGMTLGGRWAEAADEIERLRAALREIADDPCIDPEGNAAVARKALEQ